MDRKVSKRKMESYKRAEMVCQELRHQLSKNVGQEDMRVVVKYLHRWMDGTGNIKYNRPKKLKTKEQV